MKNKPRANVKLWQGRFYNILIKALEICLLTADKLEKLYQLAGNQVHFQSEEFVLIVFGRNNPFPGRSLFGNFSNHEVD